MTFYEKGWIYVAIDEFFHLIVLSIQHLLTLDESLGYIKMMQAKEITNFKTADKILIARFAGLEGRSPNFKTASCVFLISVGKENFEGPALEAQLKLINSNFKFCQILVADTLQRYNFLVSETEILSEEKAFELGTEWLNRHNQLFKSHFTDINYNICRWNEWIAQPGFNEKKIVIEQQLTSNSLYLEAMKNSIHEFMMRCKKRRPDDHTLNAQDLTDNCKKYLTEECAGLLMLGEKDFQFIVYPGKESPILAATINFLHQKESNSLSWQTLRLEKKKPNTKFFSISAPPSQNDSKRISIDLDRLALSFVSNLKCILQAIPNLEERKILLEKIESDISDEIRNLSCEKPIIL